MALIIAYTRVLQSKTEYKRQYRQICRVLSAKEAFGRIAVETVMRVKLVTYGQEKFKAAALKRRSISSANGIYIK